MAKYSGKGVHMVVFNKTVRLKINGFLYVLLQSKFVGSNLNTSDKYL